MAAQAWQHTNVNFNDVNGAMATAAGSFSKAGSLAQGLVKSINDKKLTDLKAQQTAYLLDGENRTNRLAVEANKRVVAQTEAARNLDIQHQAEKATTAQGIITNQEQLAREAQLGLNQAEFSKRLDNQGLSLIDNQPHPMSQEITALPTLLTTPSGGLSNDAISQGVPTKLPTDFDRKQFISNATQALLAKGIYTQTEANLLATQAADNELGSLATSSQIKDKHALQKGIHDGKIKQFEAMMKTLTSKGGNTTNIISGGGGSRSTVGNSSYTTGTTSIDLPTLDNFVGTLPPSRSMLGTIFGTAWTNKTQGNQNKVRELIGKYMHKGASVKQAVAFVDNQLQDGWLAGKELPEKLFSTDAKDEAYILNEMKNLGADTATTKESNRNALINASTQLKLSASKSKSIKSLYAKMQEADKAYERDYNTAAQAGTPLTGKQRAFRKYESMRKASDVVLAPSKSDKSSKSAPGDKVRKLFTDNSNPVVKAWNSKDKEGTSSLAELVTKDPKAFAEGVAGLSKEEKAKVKKFTHTKAYLDILKAKSKVITKEVAPISKLTELNTSIANLGTPETSAKMQQLIKLKTQRKKYMLKQNLSKSVKSSGLQRMSEDNKKRWEAIGKGMLTAAEVIKLSGKNTLKLPSKVYQGYKFTADELYKLLDGDGRKLKMLEKAEAKKRRQDTAHDVRFNINPVAPNKIN